MDEMKRIEKEIKKGEGTPVLSIPFGSFPMNKWKEWEDDCNKNFNGCRWMKAYSDHLKSKNSEENTAIWKKIIELETKLDMLSEKPKEEEGIKNLAGEVIA